MASAPDNTQTKIFVLTLSDDDDRRAALVSTLQSWDLEFELFFGVDGRNGLPSHYESQVDRETATNKLGREMSDGEIACALSHIKIYHEITKRGLASAIILEDDVILTEMFRKFVGLQPEEVDVLSLHHSHARVWGKPLPILPNYVARRLSMPAAAATAYWINGTAAAWMAKHSVPVTNMADWPDCISALRIWAMSPPIVDHPHVELSHLNEGRHSVPSRPARFLTGAFWRRWVTKRLSKRIS